MIVRKTYIVYEYEQIKKVVNMILLFGILPIYISISINGK